MDLVRAFRNDVFTDSMTIAAGTGNAHKSIVSLIRTHNKRLEKFGDVKFSDLKSLNPKGGRPTRVYKLNEPQATLLITFLDNTEIVADFKTELVQQFYEMKQLLAMKQTQVYQETRTYQKQIRKQETDTIKLYVEYAIKQGSSNAARYYSSLSRLADKAAGIECRNHATLQQLNNLALIENIINQCITNGIELQEPYKNIYCTCKDKLDQFSKIALIS